MDKKNHIGQKTKLKKETSSVQAVDRALSLLRFIGEASSPVSISEIANHTGLNRTTAWRLVGSLENQGFVEKDPVSKGYQLGYAVYQLVSQNDSYGPLIRRARPTMERLKEESGETVLLGVPKNNGILTIDQINTDQTIRLIDYSNAITPLHCTSNGKILLSLLPDKELDVLLEKPLKQYSKNTITDPEKLRIELQEIRVQKIGLTIGELDENENAISAPIFDKNKNLVALITIGGPSFRLKKEDLLLWRDRILEAAKQIGDQLV